MAMPKKQMTSTRSGNRRSHQHLPSLSLSECPKCHALILPHRVCPECGFYKGRDYSKVSSQATK